MTQEEERQIEEYYRLNKVEVIPSVIECKGGVHAVRIREKSRYMGAFEESPWQHNAIKALEDWVEDI